MMEFAKKLVFEYFYKNRGTITIDDVFVVWFCKTLQNWKCLVSTKALDGRYYEVTHNGDKEETYVDAYVKTENLCVKEEID